MFKAAARYNVDDEIQDKDLLEGARALHRCLLDVSIV